MFKNLAGAQKTDSKPAVVKPRINPIYTCRSPQVFKKCELITALLETQSDAQLPLRYHSTWQCLTVSGEEGPRIEGWDHRAEIRVGLSM